MIASASPNASRTEESTPGMGENVANLASDLLTLTELQARLLFLDLNEGRNQAQVPMAMLAGGLVVILGSIPVLMLAIGTALSNANHLPDYLMWLSVAGLFLFMGVILIWQSTKGLAKAARTLERSRSEFVDNLTWIKKVIQQTSMSNHR